MENIRNSLNNESSDTSTVEPDDRPLSPVLCSSGSSQKSIYSRKRSRLKSKVNLIDRFSLEQSTSSSVSKPKQESLNNLLGNPKLLDNLNVGEKIKKMKEIEEARRKFAEHFYVNQNSLTESNIGTEVPNTSSTFTFKKPISPVSTKQILKSNCDTFKNQNLTSSVQFEQIKNYQSYDKSSFEGFRTASGKEAIVSLDSIKKQSALFEDILTPEELSNLGPKRCTNLITENFKKSQIKDNIGNKTILQTSITDTQFHLAGDIAMSVDFESWTNDEFDEMTKNLDLNRRFGTSSECEDDFKGFSEPLIENQLEHSYTTLIKHMEEEMSRILMKRTFPITTNKRSLSSFTTNPSKQFKFDTEYSSHLGSTDLMCCDNERISKINELEMETTVHLKSRNSKNDLNQGSNIFNEYDFPLSEKLRQDDLSEILISVNNEFSSNSMKPMGFQTASGKGIHISNKALSRASNILQEESLPDLDKSKLTNKESFSEKVVQASNKTVSGVGNERSTRYENCSKTKYSEVDSSNPASLGFTVETKPLGFQTASGKGIHISNKALSRASNILQEESLPDLDKSKLTNKESFPEKVVQASNKTVSGVGNKRSTPYENCSKTKYSEVDSSNPASLGFTVETKLLGFQTASGKGIHISNKALSKASNILQEESLPDLDKSKLTNKESFPEKVVQASNKTVSGVGNERSTPYENCSKTKYSEVDSSNPASLGFTVETKLLGFQTASGKGIHISNKALSKASNILQEESLPDLDKSKLTNKESFPEKVVQASNKTVSGVGNERSTPYENCSKTKYSEVDSSNPASLGFTVETKLLGFQTASGKGIHISNKALSKASNILQEESLPDLDKSKLTNKESFPEKVVQASNKTVSGVGNERSTPYENCSKTKYSEVDSSNPASLGFTVETKLLGFQTASGKGIHISNKALSKASNILQEESLPDLDKSKLTNKESFPEKVVQASNKTVSGVGSERSTPYENCSKTKYSEVDSSNPASLGFTVETKLLGFQTASGKGIHISNKALSKASNILQEESLPDLDKSKLTNKESFPEKVVQASNKTVSGVGNERSTPYENCSKTKYSEVDSSNPASLGFTVETKLLGFQTASGKGIHISNKALSKASNILQEESLPDLDKSKLTNKESFPEKVVQASNKTVSGVGNERSTPYENCSKTKYSEVDSSNPASLGFTVETKLLGFQTASGKGIHISNKALSKASNILQEESLPDLDKSKLTNKESFSEKVVQASNKTVSGVGNERSTRYENCSKTKYSEVDSSNPASLGFTVETKPLGFQTASGKGIHISNKALSRASNILQEESLPDLDKSKLTNKESFSEKVVQASNKTVSGVGNERSTRYENCSKTKYSEVDSSNPASLGFTVETKPLGFLTASGKGIHISNKALSRASNILQEESLPDLDKSKLTNKESFPEKVVQASNKTVSGVGNKRSTPYENCSKTKYSEVDSSNPASLGFTVETKLLGFQTASGKGIHISNKALSKASNILQEESLPDLDKSKLTNKESFPEKVVQASNKTVSGVGNERSTTYENCSKTKYSEVDSSNPASLGFTVETKLLGFQTASGKGIHRSNKALSKASNILQEESLPDLNKSKLRNKESFAEKVVQTSKKAMSAVSKERLTFNENHFKTTSESWNNKEEFSAFVEKPTFMNDNYSKVGTNFSLGFSSASGKKIEISSKAWNSASNILKEANLPAIIEKQMKTNEAVAGSSCQGFNVEGFTSGSEKNVEISNKVSCVLQKENLHVFAEHQHKNKQPITSLYENLTSTNITGNNAINEELLDIDRDDKNFSSCMNNDLKLSCKDLNNVSHRKILPSVSKRSTMQANEGNVVPNRSRIPFQSPLKVPSKSNFNYESKSTPAKDDKTTFTKLNDLESSANNLHTPKNDIKGSIGTRNSRKRLGVTISKQIFVHKETIQRASLIFEDSEDEKPASTRNVVNPNIYSSTPVKKCDVISKPNIETFKNENNCLNNINITPIKNSNAHNNVEKDVEIETKIDLSHDQDGAVIFKKCTTLNSLEHINKEYQFLEIQLQNLLYKKQVLDSQRGFLTSNKDCNHISPRQGVLIKKKLSQQRISWSQYLENIEPGSITTSKALENGVSSVVLAISPENANDTHFNCDRNDGTKSVVHTEDGAIVVSNFKNLIGLTEITTAFEVMPGVETKLLPRNWISNHFKWIVWKLASLERNFPDKFANFLSVENLIQQLKYRYDREIDNAERPALRKILEKDDVPQKKMVLCVAGIIQISPDCFELELTDGWYGIRTIIDGPLCRQVNMNRIVVGTKLITQCAALLNCDDGCHPLEVSDSVRLKIFYNCTRRAKWNSKLGYQRVLELFPIGLHTILPDGGCIGCIKVSIARVYPIRYMEKEASGRTVLRNKRAEDKIAQEWESKRAKAIEAIQHKVQRDYETETLTDVPKCKISLDNQTLLAKTYSAKALFEMLENTNDPEGFNSMLSSDQLAQVMDYKMNFQHRKQQELSSRIHMELNNLKFQPRNVTPVLKLCVTELNGNNEQSEIGYTFNIYKPTEEHLQSITEGSTFSVYNVLPKHNGEIVANNKTHFKMETSSIKVNKTRSIIPIASLSQAKKPMFNEFDTIGTIVQLHKNGNSQNIWLTDFVGNLLLVKVVIGPDKCSLLDNLCRGHNIAVINLIFCASKFSFEQALANQCTLVTRYPRHSLLQEQLLEHCNQLPKDLTNLMNECDKKIEKYEVTVNASRSYKNSSANTLIEPTNLCDLFDDSYADTTETAMSLLDMDQYFDNRSR